MEIDKGLYKQQIKIVDEQIDRLVYDLYGLTEGEINVVDVSEMKKTRQGKARYF